MNTRLRNLALSALLLCFCATAGNAAEQSDQSSSDDMRIEMKDGLLELETRDAPLHQVIQAIGKLAGFKTVLVGEFIKPTRVSLSFKKLPVDEAIKRLISDSNRIVLYAPGDESRQRIVSQVWLLQTGKDGTTLVADDGDNFALGLETDVKGYKLAKLTSMLQQDQVLQLRVRAAMALGKHRDERAVIALESALLDEEAGVRAQAIKSLGHIGTEQATLTLGNLLLNSNANKSDRILASRALWKQDSGIAQDYLRAAANDGDPQIRSASTGHSVSSKKPGDSDGESATQ